MTETRSPRRARRLLDPRWHWLLEALHRLYDELEPDADGFGLALTVETGGQIITYSLMFGIAEIERSLVSDPDAFVAAAEAHVIDATPEATA